MSQKPIDMTHLVTETTVGQPSFFNRAPQPPAQPTPETSTPQPKKSGCGCQN